LIDAPYEISSEMIASLRIAEVIHGTCDEDDGYSSDKDERYRYAKEKGIFHVVKNPSSFRLKTIFERVSKNQDTFRTRFERKRNTETQHYKQKYNESSTS
jgi:ethanolamine-phosphate cytidylyltransferase